MERRIAVSYKDILFETSGHQFEYRIGFGALDSIAQKLKALGNITSATILCDKVDEPRTVQRLVDKLDESSVSSVVHAIRFGDEVRTFDEIGRILERLIEKGGMHPDVFIACGPDTILKMGAYLAYLLDSNIPFIYIPTNPRTALLAPCIHASIHLAKQKDALVRYENPAYICYDFESEKHLGLKTLREIYPYLARFCFANSSYAFHQLCLDAEKLKQKDYGVYLTHLSNTLYQLSKLMKCAHSREELYSSPELSFASYTQAALERAVDKNTFYPGEYLADAMRLEMSLAKRKLGLEPAYVDMINSFFETLNIKELDVDLALERYFVCLLGKSPDFLLLDEKDQEAEGLADEIELLLLSKPGEFQKTSLDQADLIGELETFAQKRTELVPVHKRRDYKK